MDLAQKVWVVTVIDKYVGEIEMLDSKHAPGVDQEELETVTLQIGLVRIVNWAYRGSHARLLSIDTDKYCAKVKVEKGIYDGPVLQAVDHEDICKITNELPESAVAIISSDQGIVGIFSRLSG